MIREEQPRADQRDAERLLSHPPLSVPILGLVADVADAVHRRVVVQSATRETNGRINGIERLLVAVPRVQLLASSVNGAGQRLAVDQPPDEGSQTARRAVTCGMEMGQRRRPGAGLEGGFSQCGKAERRDPHHSATHFAAAVHRIRQSQRHSARDRAEALHPRRAERALGSARPLCVTAPDGVRERVEVKLEVAH